jgi:hypothetical protein
MSPAGRLIGRESALAAAGSVLSDALSGSGQFLMISGEAGIGKTAMLAALINQAGPVPLVLRGFCWEGNGAPPYWPWSQVLRASGLPMAELGEAAWLLQPASRPAEPMSAAAAADAQFRLFEAVSRCLIGLAAGRPVLVVLDDLHWADEPSLRLLGFLARTLAAKAVLPLGAYRDTEASPELLELAGTAQQLALHGLRPTEVEAMVQELAETMAKPRPSTQITSQLWQRSGGNPFFVRELTRLLVAQGSWHEHTQVPASVAETLRRRLARLSTECVRLLEWAAVAGRDIDVSLLTQGGVAADEAATRGLLDEARHAGVIAGTSEPRFTHDLYRETILDGLAAAARATVNLSVGKALQARPGPAARVAAHLLAAGAQAQQDALEYSLLAAREATARLGHEDACAHYLCALQIIDERGASGGVLGGRTEILLQLAASHERAGKSDLAMQCFLQAACASRAAGDAVGLAMAALGVQTLGHRSGAQNAELLSLLREASEQLEATRGPLALQSRVLAALARTVRHGSDRLPGAEVTQTAHRAVQLATAANDASALATAKLAVHDVMWAPGSAASRLPVIAEMLDAAQVSGDDDLVAEAHLLRAAALLELGAPAGRDELLTYIALAADLGHARGRWGALTRQATFAQLAAGPAICAQLQTAADASSQAWPKWRALAHHFDIASTGIHRGAGPTPVAAEFGDLVLRVGRLAYRNQHWTPARAHASDIRNPADLAPAPCDIASAVAAVHAVADAISCIAAGDCEAVRAAAADHRLYVPAFARTNAAVVRRRYRPASPSRVDEILASYDDAIEANDRATSELDDLALALDAPTWPLAALRARSQRVPHTFRPSGTSAPHRSAKPPVHHRSIDARASV